MTDSSDLASSRSFERGPVRPAEIPDLGKLHLSDWFDPFLPDIARTALKSGGRAEVYRRADRVLGLLTSEPVENTASVFTAEPEIAEEAFRSLSEDALFSAQPLSAPREMYAVFWASLTTPPPAHRFRHEVRRAVEDDRPAVAALLREVYGVPADPWIDFGPTVREPAFVVDVEGGLAGVAWVAIGGRRARLHTLTVRPRFRSLGVGSDLVFARLLWARGAGLDDVITEISERNPVSRNLATRAGLEPRGAIGLYPRADAPSARG